MLLSELPPPSTPIFLFKTDHGFLSCVDRPYIMDLGSTNGTFLNVSLVTRWFVVWTFLFLMDAHWIRLDDFVACEGNPSHLSKCFFFVCLTNLRWCGFRTEYSH